MTAAINQYTVILSLNMAYVATLCGHCRIKHCICMDKLNGIWAVFKIKKRPVIVYRPLLQCSKCYLLADACDAATGAEVALLPEAPAAGMFHSAGYL